ncbi:hypothetical protein J2W28_006972 [Variovorax boronicumulans]|nr:hypothetical protein [Variovorax boronicumulans]MDQ0007793.1 hypothetical protein [Variovorax boronicumulans]
MLRASVICDTVSLRQTEEWISLTANGLTMRLDLDLDLDGLASGGGFDQREWRIPPNR